MKNPVIWWCAAVTLSQVAIIWSIWSIPTIGSRDVEAIVTAGLGKYLSDHKAIQICKDPYAPN